jgi:hypothetical protein
MDAESLYHQIGRIIETMPDFSGYMPLTTEQLVWLGRANALVAAAGNINSKVEFDLAAKNIQTAARHDAAKSITLLLYKALGEAELKAPPNVKGSFIPAGSSFDALAAITKLFREARTDILVVDPYLDDTALIDFGASVPDGVTLRLLSDQATVKDTLAPAAQRWIAQHGASRPLAVRLANAKMLHDRAVIIDSSTVWTLTQSLKDFARRSPAEIIRADDIAPLKIAAYEDIWKNATIIA